MSIQTSLISLSPLAQLQLLQPIAEAMYGGTGVVMTPVQGGESPSSAAINAHVV